MLKPVWIDRQALLVLHSRSIAIHGGVEGLRDEGLLDSALHRAQNRFHYEGVSEIAELAATYGVAIAANHPFVDGNKRAAFQCAALFLRLNGWRLVADRVDATRAVVGLAAGDLDQSGFADWVRANSRST
jgi:death-on-curing protein